MHGCSMDLNCLSIGNNSIKSLDNLMYLRKFKKLRLLNLEGNPVCHDPEYRMFVLAHIKYLKYLDYGLLSEADVVAAKEQYQVGRHCPIHFVNSCLPTCKFT